MSRKMAAMTLVMAAWVAAMVGCKPQMELASAAEALVVAAVPELEQLAQGARAELGDGQRLVSGGVEVLEAMTTAVQRARITLAERSEGWQLRAVAMLREALAAYQRLRAAGVPLPPPPPLVVELLTPCADSR